MFDGYKIKKYNIEDDLIFDTFEMHIGDASKMKLQ